MGMHRTTSRTTSAEYGGKSAQCKVLLVDDDAMFIALCKTYLKKSKTVNYIAESAHNVVSGLNKCLSNEYDCLIVDYRLPDGTGTQMLELVKQQLGQKKVPPTIVLTASSARQAATDAIRSDAVDFIVKSDVSPSSLDYAIHNAQHKAILEGELRSQYDQLTLAYKELKDKTEEITRFYHTVSHEVKTPVSAMREFVQLLNDQVAGPVNEEQQVLLKFTTECCDTIVRHFHDLLDIARIDTDKMPLHLDAHSPEPLIQFCVKGAQGLARDKEITLQHRVDPGMPSCLIDARRIKQVLSNLIENAIKFTPCGGRVTVEAYCKKPEKLVEFNVTDTGCGIPDAAKEKVFDRLYQVPLGSEHEASSGGMGLGLSIAREIVQRHNGELLVESTVGYGATFRVLLPIGSEEAAL